MTSLLRSITSVLDEWLYRPRPEREAILENIHVDTAMGTLVRSAALGEQAPPTEQPRNQRRNMATNKQPERRRGGAQRAEPVTGRAAVRMARHLEIALARVELSLPQYRVLVLLERGSAAASALASKLAVSPPSVTALVDGLVARGLLERQPVARDRRRVDHVLTPEGRKMLAKADTAVSGRLEEIVAYLPPVEQKRAIDGLDLWTQAMDAWVEAKVGGDSVLQGGSR